MVGPQQISFGEVALLFICQEHSVFHSYRLTSVLFFCYCIWFSFFALICVQILSYLCIKVYFDLWYMLVFIKRVVFKKVRMVLEKRKSFMQKSGTKKSLCRLRPRLLHVVLDVFLIVCLAVLL
jgi:hypothetical protein